MDLVSDTVKNLNQYLVETGGWGTRKKELDGVYFWFTENSPVAWEQYLQGLRADGYSEDDISYLSGLALRDATSDWAQTYSESFKEHGLPEGQTPKDWCNDVMLESCLENPAIVKRLLELAKAEFLAECQRKGL